MLKEISEKPQNGETIPVRLTGDPKGKSKSKPQQQKPNIHTAHTQDMRMREFVYLP